MGLLSTMAYSADDALPVLDTSSFWRCWFELKMPVFRKGVSIVSLPEAFPKEWKDIRGARDAKWLTFDSPPPGVGWTLFDFDDQTWHRMPGTASARVWARKRNFVYRDSCYMARIFRRGRFTVTDPTRVGELTLSLAYSGGVVVYLNGVEVGRGHIAKDAAIGPETLAEDYREDKLTTRTLSLALPVGGLRRGVNVLAFEIIRAPYREKDIHFSRNWTRTFSLVPGSCALRSVRLSASPDAAIVPNTSRPKGFHIWNGDVVSSDFDLDYGEANEPLRPIVIAAARNGAFSGKVVVGSDTPIRGLKATIEDLKRAGGGTIPSSAVRIRYASPGVTASVAGSIDFVHFYGGTEAGANRRYLATADRFDALDESPPTEVPVRRKRPHRDNLKVDDISTVFGAVTPIWVTIDIPADIRAGDYEGTLRISADAVTPVEVPVKLNVADWRLPDPAAFRTFAELVQSPESVALWYDVPLWSDRHFQLVARSLEWAGRVGAKTCVIPLICETNMGNAHTMVRWIPKDDGTYRYDFTVMDRYLDLVVKHQGKPAVVCFYVWDNFLPSTGRKNWGTSAAKNYEGGPEVDMPGKAPGTLAKLQLPVYTDPRSRALWQPLLREVRARMRKRGLEDVMMLGMVSDRMPDKATAEFFKELLPGVPWVSCSHNFPKNLHGVPFGCQTNAYDISGVLDPTVARQHGWKLPTLVKGTHFPRLTQDIFPLTTFRFMGEMNISRNYRGFARLGADFWPVLRNKRGLRVGRIAARYPKSSWWNLNLITSLLAPGPDGAIATVRYEMLREGIQECEARIFIERVLTDRALRAKLGEDMAKRCQDVLDARMRPMLRGVFSLVQDNRFRTNEPNDWWQHPGIIGAQWFGCSNREQRTAVLFAAAAEVGQAIRK